MEDFRERFTSVAMTMPIRPMNIKEPVKAGTTIVGS
jgi:hypothetical protein